MTSTVRGESEQARAVVTNGIGKRTTAHLNRTRSLADVWGVRPIAPVPVAASKPVQPKPVAKPRAPEPAPRIPYAGRDRNERL